MLAATEPGLEPDPVRASRGLTRVLAQLQQRTWASEIGMNVSPAKSIGVMSLGYETMMVLESACTLGDSEAVLRTDRKAVARGLGYLRRPLSMKPPWEADVLLLPGIASDSATMWTYRRFAAAAWKATGEVVPVIHPVARLSPLSRLAFRPPAGVYPIDLP
jgi:hypothetical protein